MKPCCAAVLLVLLAGCGTTSRAVRLDTGQSRTITFTPRSTASPVELSTEGFTVAVAKLSRTTKPSPQPQEAARRLFEVAARSESYTYEWRNRRLLPLDANTPQGEESTATEAELTRAYLTWCERTGRPGDCLRLLAESPTVTGDGRFALALGLARGAVWDEMGEVETIAVSAGSVTIALAPGAVAMSARNTSGDGNPRKAPVLPEERAKHIFRDAPGHLRDTPTHRQWIQEVAADESARLGMDRFGNEWFARTNPDGTQVWAQVRHGHIINGGLNQIPRNYNSQLGLSAPSQP